MHTRPRVTAEDVMTAVNAVGMHAQWAWTGGSCRAVLVQTGPRVADPHVLITHEWDPFTDHDLHEDLSGQNLALGLYASEEDDDPAMRIHTATDSSRIAEAAVALLTPSNV